MPLDSWANISVPGVSSLSFGHRVQGSFWVPSTQAWVQQTQHTHAHVRTHNKSILWTVFSSWCCGLVPRLLGPGVFLRHMRGSPGEQGKSAFNWNCYYLACLSRIRRCTLHCSRGRVRSPLCYGRRLWNNGWAPDFPDTSAPTPPHPRLNNWGTSHSAYKEVIWGSYNSPRGW